MSGLFELAAGISKSHADSILVESQRETIRELYAKIDRLENELDSANDRVGLLESELADCRDGVDRV